ncbi:MAG: hypothetical protein JNL11_02220 [Bdellovibrionaceae bacterium]|nr:hypothetical protein [Pseudobdellovibrionaceae bacterium]
MVRNLIAFVLYFPFAYAGDPTTTHTHVINLKGKYDPRVLVMGVIALVILIAVLWFAPHSTKKKKNKKNYFKTKNKRGKGMKLPY